MVETDVKIFQQNPNLLIIEHKYGTVYIFNWVDFFISTGTYFHLIPLFKGSGINFIMLAEDV
jgi:hypothetical protein